MREFYEFFAGGGMVRAGLGSGWICLFANDFDRKKGEAYRSNWGDQALKVADVASLSTRDLPGKANLIWASFPCQDLSLAGAGAGLKGERSGTFWPFWKLTKSLIREGRAAEILVLENVCGTLTSHSGRDFLAIARELVEAGHRLGALIIDAQPFVPQSRPRLFIIAIRAEIEIPEHLVLDDPPKFWSSRGLVTAYGRLPKDIQENWIWWRLPKPSRRRVNLVDIIESDPVDAQWLSSIEIDRLLAMMSGVNRAKLESALKENRRVVGTLYKRTRRDEYGLRVQRAEVRFDDVAGCLRTPAGGSSRQSIVIVENNSIRVRLISCREAARLMGLSEEYKLPKNYNEAYHLIGDGVVVPVVRHLAKNIFEPIINCLEAQPTLAA